jgi:hypothetical protein
MVSRSRDVRVLRAFSSYTVSGRRELLESSVKAGVARPEAAGQLASSRDPFAQCLVARELQRTLAGREGGGRDCANKQRDGQESGCCVRDGRERQLVVLLMVAATSQ